MMKSVLHRLIEIALENGWDMFGWKDKMMGWVVEETKIKALKVGFEHVFVELEVFPDADKADMEDGWKWFGYTPEEIIFNHDFAKALFGEKDEWHTTKCTCGGNAMHVMGFDTHREGCARPKAPRGYKYHLGELVVEEDRLAYLERWLLRHG